MIPCDLSIRQSGAAGGSAELPVHFATDTTQSPPNLLVYPAVRRLSVFDPLSPPDAGHCNTERTSSTVPWFPNSQYLRTRLRRDDEDADDDRWEKFLW